MIKKLRYLLADEIHDFFDFLDSPVVDFHIDRF